MTEEEIKTKVKQTILHGTKEEIIEIQKKFWKWRKKQKEKQRSLIDNTL